MIKMHKIQIFTGRLLYIALFPVRKAYRSKYTRAYGVIEYQDKILLIKNWLGSGAWSLPGGGGHQGEEFKDTLAREINEEVGLKIDKSKAKLIIKDEHAGDFGKKKFVIFHIKQENKPSIVLNHLEIVDYKWVDKKDLAQVRKSSHELRCVTEKNL